jgi:hypothetical protein
VWRGLAIGNGRLPFPTLGGMEGVHGTLYTPKGSCSRMGSAGSRCRMHREGLALQDRARGWTLCCDALRNDVDESSSVRSSRRARCRSRRRVPVARFGSLLPCQFSLSDPVSLGSLLSRDRWSFLSFLRGSFKRLSTLRRLQCLLGVRGNRVTYSRPIYLHAISPFSLTTRVKHS